METIELVILIVLSNWAGMLLISWLYVGWLWLVSRDVKLEGWIFWRGWIPFARFRLISTKSWYARAWDRWYGMSFGFIVIHKDELGAQDDAKVDKVIVHEIRHCLQQLCLGLIHWLSYVGDYLRLKLFTDKDPYYDNWAERDARAAADRWVAKGRPKIYALGARR